MNKKILVLTLAAALGVGGLFALNAGAQAVGQRRAPRAMMQRAKQYLGLTDAQAAQIRSIVQNDRKNLSDLARAIHDGRAKLRDTIQNETASEADVRAASADLAKAQANMAVERHKLSGKIKPILTPGQLTKLAQIQERVDAFVDGAIDTFEQKLAE
jgi:Spy/CpxP family protein refolding chaperone